MQYTTKLEFYKGQYLIRIPNEITRKLHLKPGDEYEITLMPDRSIFIQFKKT